MSKKFGNAVLVKLQSIRYKLDDMENCEDSDEMVHIAQELSADIVQIESLLEDKYKLV